MPANPRKKKEPILRNLPSVLTSTEFGELSYFGYCDDRDYCYVAQIRYKQHPEFKLVLRPPEEITLWDDFMQDVHIRSVHILVNQLAICESGEGLIQDLCEQYSYVEEGKKFFTYPIPAVGFTVRDCYPHMRLEQIMINANAYDEITYWLPYYPSLDMLLQIDRNYKVVNANFDG